MRPRRLALAVALGAVLCGGLLAPVAAQDPVPPAPVPPQEGDEQQGGGVEDETQGADEQGAGGGEDPAGTDADQTGADDPSAQTSGGDVPPGSNAEGTPQAGDPEPAVPPADDAAAPGGEGAAPAVPAAGSEAVGVGFDLLAPLASSDAAGLAARFAEIAASRPDRARAEALPSAESSAAGAGAPLLVLGATDAPGPDARPALAFVGWGAADDLDAALAIAARLLEPENAALLERATVYLLPLLTGGEGTAGSAVAARNFPVGWRPETVIPGSGPYPLSEPSSRALAVFLQARTNLVVLLALRDGPCTGPEVEGIFADRYRAELRPLRPGGLLERPVLAECSLCPATAASYAWAARGIFPARIDEPPVLDRLSRNLSLARAGAALDALRALPGLAIGEPGVQVLRPGQIRLDLRVENTGMLPTRGAAAAAFGHTDAVELTVEGAQVLACAAGPVGVEPAVQRERGGRYALGDIAGGGALSVRLIVAVEPGAEVRLTCSAPRAGSAVRTVPIPR